MIVIVDYGMGNLRSVAKAVEYLGYDVQITDESSAISRASHIILPGVGAFPDGIRNLRPLIPALEEAVIKQGRPFLGICLGMQMLATEGEEKGTTQGLDWIPGRVTYLDGAHSSGLKVPHVGWNDIELRRTANETPLSVLKDGIDVYFVHSYAFQPTNEDDIAATCTYGERITAAVRAKNILATQFHPEKSQAAGMKLLEAFLHWKIGGNQ